MSGNADLLVDGPASLWFYKGELTDEQEAQIFDRADPSADAAGEFTNELDDLGFLVPGGYTTAALALAFSQTVRQKTVQQKKDPVKTRRQTRGATVGTTLGEADLPKVALAIDAVYDEDDHSIEPNEGSDVTEYSVVWEGWGPFDLRRRGVLRRSNNTDNVTVNYDAANDTGVPVVFTGLAPQSGKKSWKMADEKPATGADVDDINYATRATAGSPGTFGPAGTAKPTSAAQLGNVAASPATAWTTGQYVALADGSKYYWDGTKWTAGTAA